MKKILLCLIIFVSIQLPLFAEENQANSTPPPVTEESKVTVRNPAEKLNRGIVNIITSPLEIAKQIDRQWKENKEANKSVSEGVMWGLVKGVGYTAGRMGSGVWDVLSFPFKGSKKNYEPLMKPEFVLDEDQ